MTKVKICGITNADDAHVALDAGADMLGFIFFPRSPRHVTPVQARTIAVEIRSRSLIAQPRLVGVFVDQDPHTVTDTLDFCEFDDAQLHSKESPETLAVIAAQGFGVIKAFRVRNVDSLNEMAGFRATAYLLDAYVPGQLGGTGQSFDWSLAMQAKRHGPVLLAGGLTPDNVSLAIKSVHPWGVDVSSGVEAAPGRKNPDKVRRFIRSAKQACSENMDFDPNPGTMT